jgi:ferredoxin
MTYVITDACVDIKDATCVGECPVDCIYEGPRSLYIHPDECIDCGACEPVCPVGAIKADWGLPEEQRAAAPRAVEVFAPLGLPNGARRHGPLGTDHPYIAALPSRTGTP